MSFHGLLNLLIGVKGDIRRVAFVEAEDRFVCHLPDDSLWGAAKDNLLLSEYERADTLLADFQNGLVIDCGAHVGLFAMRAAAYAGRVIAFEPHPQNFSLLQYNLSQNSCQRVEARPHALSGRTGDLHLKEDRRSDASSVSGEGRSFAVYATTIDELVTEVGTIDLLKLDIEGAEFDAVGSASDASLQKVRSIVAELHLDGRDTAEADLTAHLRASGFEVTILDPPVASWGESVATLLRRWRKVNGLLRLKIVVLVVYSAAAAARALELDRFLLFDDGLKFLYARRPGLAAGVPTP